MNDNSSLEEHSPEEVGSIGSDAFSEISHVARKCEATVDNMQELPAPNGPVDTDAQTSMQLSMNTSLAQTGLSNNALLFLMQSLPQSESGFISDSKTLIESLESVRLQLENLPGKPCSALHTSVLESIQQYLDASAALQKHSQRLMSA